MTAARESNPVCITEFANTPVIDVEVVHIFGVLWTILYNKPKPLE